MDKPVVKSSSEKTEPVMDRLIEVMAKLRDPENGCPWDREQTFATIAPYTIEEAYEVAEAISEGDMAELRKELGDLLFQVVFYAQMAREQGEFDFEDVAEAITEKMIKRHPHVFSDLSVADADAQSLAWEVQKENERAERAVAEGRAPSVLDDVAAGFPALMRAHKLQKRAARVGFDWPDVSGVLDKVAEEAEELKSEIAEKDNGVRVEEEFGDLLFSLVNLGRWIGADPETALRNANSRFENRFRRVEAVLAERGELPSNVPLEELEALWQSAKRHGTKA